MKLKVIGAVIPGMVVFTAGVLFFTLQQVPPAQTANIEEHLIHTDMIIYKDIKELTAESSLIFEGTVEQILPASRVVPKDAAKRYG